VEDWDVYSTTIPDRSKLTSPSRIERNRIRPYACLGFSVAGTIPAVALVPESFKDDLLRRQHGPAPKTDRRNHTHLRGRFFRPPAVPTGGTVRQSRWGYHILAHAAGVTPIDGDGDREIGQLRCFAGVQSRKSAHTGHKHRDDPAPRTI